MPAFSRIYKYAFLGVGAASGAAAFYYINTYGNELQATNQKVEYNFVPKSHTTDYKPLVKWDTNWDRRDPESLTKPIKVTSEKDAEAYKELKESYKAKAVRHLLLIRHGQYNLAGETDKERVLTELGKRQAEFTGRRLAELNLPYSLIVKSTMSRAQETAAIIEKFLPNVPVIEDSILVEGAPIPPEPPVSHWKPENHYFQDGARIEAAYRKYFHRAPPTQTEDSYTVIVCHANVIRYFTCRALQLPPEAWLRFSLKHGSITWISILPSGRVALRAMGEAGYMGPEFLTTS